jgi:hypothetical protein
MRAISLGSAGVGKTSSSQAKSRRITADGHTPTQFGRVLSVSDLNFNVLAIVIQGLMDLHAFPNKPATGTKAIHQTTKTTSGDMFEPRVVEPNIEAKRTIKKIPKEINLKISRVMGERTVA